MNMPELFDVIRLIPKTDNGQKEINRHGDVVDVILKKKTSFCALANDGRCHWIDFPIDSNFLWQQIADFSTQTET